MHKNTEEAPTWFLITSYTSSLSFSTNIFALELFPSKHIKPRIQEVEKIWQFYLQSELPNFNFRRDFNAIRHQFSLWQKVMTPVISLQNHRLSKLSIFVTHSPVCNENIGHPMYTTCESPMKSHQFDVVMSTLIKCSCSLSSHLLR